MNGSVVPKKQVDIPKTNRLGELGGRNCMNHLELEFPDVSQAH